MVRLLESCLQHSLSAELSSWASNPVLIKKFEKGMIRCVVKGERHVKNYFKTGGKSTPELDSSFELHRILVVLTDQAPANQSAWAWLNEEGFWLFVDWDPLHRMYNDLKGSLDPALLWAIKALLDMSDAPSKSQGNIGILREQASRLLSMDDNEIASWLSEDLPFLEEELELPQGTDVRQLAAEILATLDECRLHTCPIRRWFYICAQLGRLRKVYSSFKILIRMQRQQDSLGKKTAATRNKVKKTVADASE